LEVFLLIKLNEIKNNLILSKTKLFSFKELKWFILSLVVLSSLFSVGTSFLLGFSEQELFISESSDDIIVISEPEITPAQSRIPHFWTYDILELSGVQYVSPETVDVIIDHTHDETPFFRGVTSDYKKLESNFELIDGEWFN